MSSTCRARTVKFLYKYRGRSVKVISTAETVKEAQQLLKLLTREEEKRAESNLKQRKLYRFNRRYFLANFLQVLKSIQF